MLEEESEAPDTEKLFLFVPTEKFHHDSGCNSHFSRSHCQYWYFRFLLLHLVTYITSLLLYLPPLHTTGPLKYYIYRVGCQQDHHRTEAILFSVCIRL